MKILWNIFTTMAAVAAITCCGQSGWSAAEKELIGCDGATMRVLTVYDAADSLVLRKECGTISEKELKSHEYQSLADKMVATVTSPEEDGVGIAGPQVGISRRIVAVQRFDKAGEPFEVYPNIRITAGAKGNPVPKDVSAFREGAAKWPVTVTSTSPTRPSGPYATQPKASADSPPSSSSTSATTSTASSTPTILTAGFSNILRISIDQFFSSICQSG